METVIMLLIMAVLVIVIVFQSDSKTKLKQQIDGAKQASNLAIQQAELVKQQANMKVKANEEMLDNLIASAEIIELESTIIYQRELDKARSDQKDLVKLGEAIILPPMTYDGSAAKGKALMRKVAKLVLRAYDYETKDAIRNVKPGNLEATGMKISKTAGVISRILHPSFEVHITQRYIDAKIRELSAFHKHALAKQAEKEAEAAIKEELREQAKAEQEHATAVQQADDEAKVAQKAYDKALLTIQDQHSEEMQKLKQLLDDALAKKERAKSQAQLTKAGHIYVIKNTGSFGEGVYKVGLTRRLVPMDRVKELSGAAVPFPFAVNALFYTHNAPEMEKKLHHALHAHRVNKVNNRKEFFKVPLSVIEAEARALGITVSFITSPEELDWEETRRQRNMS